MPSEPEEASVFPSGLNATLRTGPSWPLVNLPRGRPEGTSQSPTVPSKLAEASECPSGLNATPTTWSLCPGRGRPSGRRDRAFQSRR